MTSDELTRVPIQKETEAAERVYAVGDERNLPLITPPKRNRRPLPPIGEREWMTAEEAAAVLGCSIATLHRLRRGLIPNIPPLPSVPVGTRKFIFRKATVKQWQDEREQVA